MPCIFCEIIADKLPVSKVYEDDQLMAFMDIHPLARGHVLIIPKQHARSSLELDEALRARQWQLGHEVAAALKTSSIPFDAHHFLINDGKASNQSVPHVHLHVIPRVRGDGIKVPFRMIGHVMGIRSPLPISKRKRANLDADAALIRGEFRASL